MNYNGFKIICLGTYCLPRVIATYSYFKPRRSSGEKTCPFDLAFCWDFEGIINLLDNEFENFFDEVEYNYLINKKIKDDLAKIFGCCLTGKVWKHEKAGIVFNHENYIPFEQFKSLYSKRIKNIFEYIKNTDNEVYFLIATFNPISDEQITRLNNVVTRFREKDSFFNIIINQSGEKLNITQENTYIIDCDPNKYNKMFQVGWVEMLSEHEKYPLANDLYNDIKNELKKIIFKDNK